MRPNWPEIFIKKEGNMKKSRAIVLAAGVLFFSTLSAAGTTGLRHPIEFTLVASNPDPEPLSFTLAPRLVISASSAGPGRTGIIEEPYPICNTALGYDAFSLNDTGHNNTAIGYYALYNNTTGTNHTAVGSHTLYCLIEGDHNTAVGSGALAALQRAIEVTAIGNSALTNLLEGPENTALGSQALWSQTGGCSNTALGTAAGFDLLFGHSNIFIGAHCKAQPYDNHTIRIGRKYEMNEAQTAFIGQNTTFIAGIAESPLDAGQSPEVVGVTAEGQLGTFPSELLPKGDPGPPGEGFFPGALLFLPPGVSAPSGYTLLGRTEFLMQKPDRKIVKLIIRIYQKD
jgi:hypothetical protein